MGTLHRNPPLCVMSATGQVQTNFGALTKRVAWSPVPSRADVRSLTWRWDSAARLTISITVFFKRQDSEDESPSGIAEGQLSWATEPKSPAPEVRPRLLDEVHGRHGNLTVAAVTSGAPSHKVHP